MSILIRNGSIDDLDRLYQIEKLCFESQDVFSKNTFAFFLTNKNSICLIAFEKNNQKENIIGFIIIYQKKNSKFEVVTLNVHPSWQNKGIGTKLLQEIEQKLIEMKQTKKAIQEKANHLTLELVVYEHNKSAMHLYKKMGYEKIRKIKNYYSNKRNGIKMIKKINYI